MSDARLLLPPGWLVDDLSRDRLAHQLRRAPAHLTAVVAPVTVPPPGSSFRVHAERLALQPLSAVSERASAPPGAALVRAGRAEGDRPSGPVLVDHGTATHDPGRTGDVLDDASPLGRPPFPWRPVVLFVGLDVDQGVAAWASRLVDALVPLDVEARLAVPEPPPLRLVQPCLPGAASVACLRPDVLVALDEGAAATADGWLDGDRSAVVAHHVDAPDVAVETVPWTLGRAAGRLRARLGPAARPDSVAALVRRLVSGPHPIAPRRAPAPDAVGTRR